MRWNIIAFAVNLDYQSEITDNKRCLFLCRPNKYIISMTVFERYVKNSIIISGTKRRRSVTMKT